MKSLGLVIVGRLSYFRIVVLYTERQSPRQMSRLRTSFAYLHFLARLLLLSSGQSHEYLLSHEEKWCN
jgi:hypothetical protein